jgi:hypothetical protein
MADAVVEIRKNDRWLKVSEEYFNNLIEKN